MLIAAAPLTLALALLTGLWLRAEERGDPAAGRKSEPRGLDLDAPPESRAKPGQRWAFLVGIDDYLQYPRLNLCSADMWALRKVLIESCAFDHVSILTTRKEDQGGDADGAAGGAQGLVGPTNGSIIIELDAMLEQTGEDDLVLFAFSGHGCQAKSGNESGAAERQYLIASDTSGRRDRLEKSALSIEELHKSLQKSKARQKLLILDACHSGGSIEGEKDAEGDSLNPGLLPRRKGFAHLCSCAADQKSWEDEKLGHGVFTHFLIKGLEGAADRQLEGNHDGQVTLSELSDYVGSNVKAHVWQMKKRTQDPILEQGGDATRLVLSARKSRGQNEVPSLEDIAGLLDEMRRLKLLPDDLDRKSKDWLEVDPAFPPAREMRLLLSLFGLHRIKHDEFKLLSRHLGRQLESRIAAEKSFSARKVRAVVIGVDKYAGLASLQYAVSDARTLANGLQRFCGAEVDLLVESDADRNRVLKALQDAVDATKPRDLLVVAFCGQGVDQRTLIRG
jgi:uncharacterized caspase-like protein